MTRADDIEACETCGGPVRDHYPAVVVREGARGVFLVPTFLLDGAFLLYGEDAPPTPEARADIALAMRALRRMTDRTLPDVSGDDWQALHDAIPHMDGALYAAGYRVCWDDGYTIYAEGES